MIGRTAELNTMKNLLEFKKGELLAVFGRRRVGKTYLVKHGYAANIVFDFTGTQNTNLENQLLKFNDRLNHYFKTNKNLPVLTNWHEALYRLKQHLIKRKKSKLKPVVFFDEFPWIAGRKSKFLQEFGYWWNTWANWENIVVVICGSAASWMIEKIVNDRGGMHNRITSRIFLEPFTLHETKLFLQSKKVKLSNFDIAQLYMAIGGIPHYLSFVKPGETVTQTINNLLFAKNGVLRNEFENLYAALFENYENHIKIIKALAQKQKGLTRNELLKITKFKDGGAFTKLVEELKTSSFIGELSPLENRKKDTLYRLTDEYSLFYIRFIMDKNNINKNIWGTEAKHKIWQGYAFENLCLKHINEINKALGIDGIGTYAASYYHNATPDSKGFQIDLLIDRADNAINICEMKFYNKVIKLTKNNADAIREKMHLFRQQSGTKKMILNTIVSTYGAEKNMYYLSVINKSITLDDLF